MFENQRSTRDDESGLPESLPYSCLTSLTDVVDTSDWRRLTEKYELAFEPSCHRELTHWQCRHGDWKNHKHEAVVLFVAALEAVACGTVSAVFLHEVSRLHQWLARALEIPGQQFSADGQAAEWEQRPGTVTLCPAMCLHLRQAGFLLPFRDSPLLIHFRQSSPFLLLEEALSNPGWERIPVWRTPHGKIRQV